MSTSLEEITIEPCPVCAGRHTYGAEVKRSVRYRVSTDLAALGSQKYSVFKKLLTCPETSRPFEAEVRILDIPSTTIKDVTMRPFTR